MSKAIAARLANVSLPRAIIEGSIIELVGDRFKLPPDVKKSLEDNDLSLRQGILKTLGFDRVEKLGTYLLEHPNLEMQIASTVSGILVQGTPGLAQTQSMLVSAEYVNTVMEVAAVV